MKNEPAAWLSSPTRVSSFSIFRSLFSIFHCFGKRRPRMRLSWWTKELLAGITLLGLVGVAAAQAKGVPTVEQMLSIKPVQKGIVYTTPTPQEFSKCKVEVVDGAAKGTSAFVLRDGQGQMLRKFYDSNG